MGEKKNLINFCTSLKSSHARYAAHTAEVQSVGLNDDCFFSQGEIKVQGRQIIIRNMHFVEMQNKKTEHLKRPV